MTRTWIIKLVVVGFLLLAWLITPGSILGGAPGVSLKPAPDLSGLVAQNLVSGQAISSLPVAGKDFNLTDVRYFDNNSWVVARVNPVHHNFDTSIVVLEKINDDYQVVLGPGNLFDSSYLLSMPADVGSYLSSQGVVSATH